MIKAIIIDDEPYCCEVLAELLNRHCPQVRITDICHSGGSALKAIADTPPDLVFLDIEMPEMNGFELLERLGAVNFKLIFTTSYDQYAIKAFRFSAMDYLLKPIDREELQQAVARAGNQMLTAEGIISCRAERNHTILSLKTGQKLTVSRTLKEFEEMLADYAFLRIHHSHLINLKEVTMYVQGEGAHIQGEGAHIQGEGGYVLMSDGSAIDVSQSRKDLLLSKLSGTQLR